MSRVRWYAPHRIITLVQTGWPGPRGVAPAGDRWCHPPAGRAFPGLASRAPARLGARLAARVPVASGTRLPDLGSASAHAFRWRIAEGHAHGRARDLAP